MRCTKQNNHLPFFAPMHFSKVNSTMEARKKWPQTYLYSNDKYFQMLSNNFDQG